MKIKLKLFIITLILGAILLATAPLEAQISFESIKNSVDEDLAEMSSYFSYSSAQPGNTYQAAIVVEIIPHWHINSAKPLQDFLIPTSLSFDTTTELIPQNINYPRDTIIELLGEKMAVYDNRAIIIFDIRIADDASYGESSLPLSFQYQACNDRECRAPETIETELKIIIGDEGEAINSGLFASSGTQPVEAKPVPVFPSEESDLEKLINKYGFWGYFLALGLAYITGLLLSFSPCTYPMIPITVSIFAGQKRSVGGGFILSLFYVGSMAVMYGIMGLIVSLVGGVFGAWLASPAVVIGIAVVFVIFSLSMFGLYELQVPAFIRNKLGSAQSGGGVGGSIVLGIIAALVVSPCVGPFVAGILLYIATYGSPLFGFVTLFIFAIGLGTLYIIIGTFSSAIGSLPGAGTWMESIKKFFGFILLIMALYFLRTVLTAELISILAGLLLLAFAVFGGGLDKLIPESPFFDRLKKYLGLLAFLIGTYLLIGSMITSGFIVPPISKWLSAGIETSTQNQKKLIKWNTELAPGLALAESLEKPVLIDTWATWCINCKVLEKKTFNNPDVAKEAERFVALKIQLEKSDSPETMAFMKRFGLKQYSLPTTLLLDSEGNTRMMRQGVIDPDEMIAEMRKVE